MLSSNHVTFQGLVRKKLLELGFGLVRFAHPPLGKSAEYFKNWLKQDFHGKMAYLSRRSEERLNPQKLLPEIRSVIVVSFPYDTRLANTQKLDEGNISRYAWGQDYHELMGRRLHQFERWFLTQKKGIKCYSSVDAQPVLEKAWAQKAGIGWMGKHTNIINEKRGSYFFLAVVLTNVNFPIDSPEIDRCGTCTQCIDICPTQAIVAPYVLDARLCISYLTIELKKAIPRNLRPLIGNHVFGCDDCQEVCPWNRFSQTTTEPAFLPRENLRNQPLERLIQIDRKSFREKFKDSAIARAGWRGFIRNILVAIGNSKNSELSNLVKVKLRDASPLVRGHAVWAYEQILGFKAHSDLKAMLKVEKDEFVLSELMACLPGEC